MTFTPEEGFYDPALAPPPDPRSAPELAILPPRPQPAFPQRPMQSFPNSHRPRRALWIGGAALAIVTVVAAGFATGLIGGSAAAPPAVYIGAPVEASDVVDGKTVVGLDSSIAYIPDPRGRDMTQYFEVDGAMGPISRVDDVVAVHTIKPGAGLGSDFVVVHGHRGTAFDSPTERFASVLAEVYEVNVSELSGGVQSITTPLGLEGAVGVHDRSAEDLRVVTRFAMLGRGENTAIIEWISTNALPDEAAFMAVVNTVRVDE